MTARQLFIFLPAVVILLGAAAAIWTVSRRYRLGIGLPKESREKPSDTTFIISAFHEVTKQLKEKEKELERLRTLAEQRAENVESYNDNILQCVTSGVMTFDLECRLTTANRAAEEILHMQRGAELGRTCSEILGDGAITAAVHETLNRKEPSARMEAMLGRGSTNLWLGFNTAALTDRHGETIGVILSFSDLTEVKRLQERMELQERLTALGEMSAGIAHELRNPMAVISGYLRLLSKQTDEAGRELIGNSIREIDGMNRIIGDLLTFARPASLNRAQVDLREMIESCLAAALQATGAGETIMTEQRLDPVEAIVDEVLFRQAFTNLIQNAIEAMPDGGTLSLALLQKDGEVTFTVKDTGPGIPPDIRKKIFLPFFTTKDKGVGMGLALAHKIVTSHGGRIEVESEAGKGARFNISLPAGERSHG